MAVQGGFAEADPSRVSRDGSDIFFLNLFEFPEAANLSVYRLTGGLA
jgi:hypothetical protein